MRGADVPAVQRILRHSDPRLTTETYGHLVPDYLRAQIDRLSFGVAASNDSQPVATIPAPFAPILLPQPKTTRNGPYRGDPETE